MNTTLIPVLGTAFFAAAVPSFAQGGLTPTQANGALDGADNPQPSMKTLAQVEPRLDLSTVSGDADYHHIITVPGSYYLTGNLAVTKTHGIDVRAAGVTLDLMGFEISGAGGTGHGIEVDATAHRCTIRNGSLSGFSHGVRSFPSAGAGSIAGLAADLAVTGCSTAGLDLGTSWTARSCRAHHNQGIGILAGDGCHLVGCTSRSNSGDGIQTGDSCTLQGCSADENNPGNGIHAGDGCTLADCTARANVLNANQAFGIRAGEGSTLTNCAARENQCAGNTGYGIWAGGGSSLHNCSASFNRHTGPIAAYGIFADRSTLRGCTAVSNSSTGTVSWGIAVSNQCTLVACTSSSNVNSSAPATFDKGGGIFASGCTIRECTVAANSGDGIRVRFRSFVSGNTCDFNGIGTGAGSGIHATDTGNTILANNATGNVRG
ncbi:MAG: hypothetical protein HKO57_17215, partial [Akkermansiaceae bacterium]|nr:hypothetical protein [Akkermansiaceae bacterium]